ncbi:hypothetical protein ACS0TY_021865 [Phlomoides rotata]
MAKGPSPLIPLLLVVALGLLLRSDSFPAALNLPLVSEAENTLFTFIILIPFVVLVAIYSTTHSILLPLALLLVTYTVTTKLLGPLTLILIVYLVSVCSPSFKCNGEELAWGCALALGFFVLHWLLADEGRHWPTVIIAIILFFSFHFSSS